MTSVRGVRGATTASANTREAVLEATTELIRQLVSENEIDSEDLAAVHFNTSPDLVAEFPAVAVREGLGWDYVPLLNGQEIDRPDAQRKCIRVLMLWNTDKSQREIKHVYLRDATSLRPDIAFPTSS